VSAFWTRRSPVAPRCGTRAPGVGQRCCRWPSSSPPGPVVDGRVGRQLDPSVIAGQPLCRRNWYGPVACRR
jgi:hypothetical protein